MMIFGQAIPFGSASPMSEVALVHGHPVLPRGGGGRSARRQSDTDFKIVSDIYIGDLLSNVVKGTDETQSHLADASNPTYKSMY
jgi:hypothetical protein